MQTDDDQTICKNKTLTHNLQQPAQESNLFIYNQQPRKPACSVSLTGSWTATSGDKPES